MTGLYILSRKSRVILILLAATVGVFVLCMTDRTFVKVVVVNDGSDAMSNVRIHVSGNSYAVREIPAGTSAMVRVRPLGESHVEVSYVDVDGKSKRLVADSYIESNNYGGTLRIHIENGTVNEVHNKIDLFIIRCGDFAL